MNRVEYIITNTIDALSYHNTKFDEGDS